MLAAWTAPTPQQERLRERYLAHLAARPDCLRRACRPDHVTASTAVLSPAADAVLLTLHAKARRWFQLGGHCEPQDRTLPGAALREASEESGLADLVVDPVPVHLSEHAVPFCGGPPRPGERATHHLDVRFVARAPAGAEARISEESLDLRWWPVDDLPDPDLAELVALARARVQSTDSPGGASTSDAADQPSR